MASLLPGWDPTSVTQNKSNSQYYIDRLQEVLRVNLRQVWAQRLRELEVLVSKSSVPDTLEGWRADFRNQHATWSISYIFGFEDDSNATRFKCHPNTAAYERLEYICSTLELLYDCEPRVGFRSRLKNLKKLAFAQPRQQSLEHWFPNHFQDTYQLVNDLFTILESLDLRFNAFAKV